METTTLPKTSVETSLTELGEKLRNAELRGDAVLLDGVLAPDFIGIGPRGFILTKEAWLGRHRSGDLKYESFERNEVTVRTYADAAVLFHSHHLDHGLPNWFPEPGSKW